MAAWRERCGTCIAREEQEQFNLSPCPRACLTVEEAPDATPD